jgi:hypothetical protein
MISRRRESRDAILLNFTARQAATAGEPDVDTAMVPAPARDRI